MIMACLSVLFISLLNRQLKHVRFGCGLASSCELIPKFCSNGPPLYKAWWSTPVFYRYIQQFHLNINSNWTFKRNVKKKKCFSKCKQNALEKSYLITTAFVFSVIRLAGGGHLHGENRLKWMRQISTFSNMHQLFICQWWAHLHTLM